MFSASQSACLKHPAALLWVHCCKCTHSTSENAFFLCFPQEQLMFLWCELGCNCWHTMLQCAAWLRRTQGSSCELLCSHGPVQCDCSKCSSPLPLAPTLILPGHSQTCKLKFHFIQINVFSSLVSLIAGYKIICLTPFLLSCVTHRS